jgi:hypothetical protein
VLQDLAQERERLSTARIATFFTGPLLYSGDFQVLVILVVVQPLTSTVSSAGKAVEGSGFHEAFRSRTEL